MERKEGSSIKPQEIITLFRRIESETKDHNIIDYPELNIYFERGFYVEHFKQTLISLDRYMITFSLSKFNSSTY